MALDISHRYSVDPSCRSFNETVACLSPIALRTKFSSHSRLEASTISSIRGSVFACIVLDQPYLDLPHL